MPAKAGIQSPLSPMNLGGTEYWFIRFRGWIRRAAVISHRRLQSPLTMTASRIHRLSLTHFRNYRAASLETRGDMVVLVGPNGAGKTNCIEAISFLSPGRGLRRATLDDVADNQGDGSWAVSAEVEGALGLATLGTGIDAPGGEARRHQPALPDRPRAGRIRPRRSAIICAWCG